MHDDFLIRILCKHCGWNKLCKKQLVQVYLRFSCELFQNRNLYQFSPKANYFLLNHKSLWNVNCAFTSVLWSTVAIYNFIAGPIPFLARMQSWKTIKKFSSVVLLMTQGNQIYMYIASTKSWRASKQKVGTGVAWCLEKVPKMPSWVSPHRKQNHTGGAELFNNLLWKLPSVQSFGKGWSPK